MQIAEAIQSVATEYNGWSNYETWFANVWLTNERPSYALLQEAISKDTWQTYKQAYDMSLMTRLTNRVCGRIYYEPLSIKSIGYRLSRRTRSSLIGPEQDGKRLDLRG